MAHGKKKNQKDQSINSNDGSFERYINSLQLKSQYNDYFDIRKTIEMFPLYMVKDDYISTRTIKCPPIMNVLFETNKTQHLFSYYSEHFASRLLECDAIPVKALPFVERCILDVKTSIIFIGYHKTLSIFKTFDERLKYFKVKKNILYGDEKQSDFFAIINQNKYVNGLIDIYKEKELNVYFAEGVFDAINLYLYNPKYITGVEPDVIVATGSKVSYASALYFVLDAFMKPIVSHLFLDPDIDYKSFFKKYRYLRRVFKRAIAYQNGSFDYGDISKTDLKEIKLCSTME